MAKIAIAFGLLGLLAACMTGCGPAGTNCNCVATAACSTLSQATETCGVGLICCPAAGDAG